MTFGPHHYVPVLKVKLNEKKALLSVPATVQQRITPLLEIVERTDKVPTVDAHLNTAFKGLADSVRSYSRCFLDTREIAPDGPSAATKVFSRASTEGIVFTPVTGITRSADVDAALSHRTHGLALRLTREEFESGDLAGNVQNFMGQHGLAPEETDLIVDLGPVDQMISEGVAALTDAFLMDVPDHARWRTFTVSACGFPSSMGGVDRQSSDLVERVDWMAWRDDLHARRLVISRLPTFSDCAIQHTSGVEGFDPRIMPMSAAIRYTLPQEWLLIKGESVRRTPARLQFLDLATQLVHGQLRDYFAGASHCPGCESIEAAAGGAGGFGSAGVWRRLGTIHHVKSVMDGLAALPWP